MEKIKTGTEIGDPEVLKTDTFLDELTGIWGLPKGRLTEFYGAEKSGKSTAAFQVIASAQKQGLKCLLVDIEHSFVASYARGLGINTDKLGVILRELAEDYLDDTLEAIESGKWDVIVLDSIGLLSSRIIAEKKSGEKSIGVQASLMHDFVMKVAPKVSYKKIVFIGITHSRQDLMTGKVMTLGGKKWSEEKKLSIEFREKSGMFIKVGEKIVGKVVNVRVMKNAVGATERKEMELDLIFGEGFSTNGNLIEEALTKGVLTKEGNTYHFGEERIGTISKLREWITLHEEEIRTAIAGHD